MRACLLVVEHRDGHAPLALPGYAPVVAAHNHGGDAALPTSRHPLHCFYGCQRVVSAWYTPLQTQHFFQDPIFETAAETSALRGASWRLREFLEAGLGLRPWGWKGL